MKKRVWITWEDQRRSIELARKLNCTLYVIDIEGWVRYPVSLLKTVSIVLKEKPQHLFVQNPSMFLATLACIIGKFTSIKIIVDRHTTFRINKPHSGSFKIWLFMRLHYFTLRNADLTIITNSDLAILVKEAQGRPFILPDRLPRIQRSEKLRLKGKFSIVLVSSFAEDEPINETLQAIKLIEKMDFYLYISGNHLKYDKDLPKKTRNQHIIFTGYLPYQKYVDTLFAADIVMALTKSECCMLCGCYEAISAKKPLITSDKNVLISYFNKAYFVDNSPQGIANGIIEVTNNIEEYRKRSEEMYRELDCKWEDKYHKFEEIIESDEFVDKI